MEADCTEFIFKNFDTFGVEMLRDSKLLSNHMDALKQDRADGMASPRWIPLQSPAYSTEVKWMHLLGFKCDSANKLYYVDGRKKPEQKEHRAQFINQYLTAIELHTVDS